MTGHGKGDSATGTDKATAATKPDMSTSPYTPEPSQDVYYKSVLDSLPDWVWEVDQNGYITYSNAAVENFLGYAPRQITGKSILSLAPQAKTDTALQLLDKQWGINDTDDYISHSFYSNEGSEISMQTSGNPFYDHNGAFASPAAW